MCSLVNAKSGGCAEDCGFCAQSRFADAETPMHAMMEPEQILEHARAAEAAGAHRFCMVTQGQGLSKRDFEKYLEGVRLVPEKTNLKRCASVGHISAERARALREAASSACTTTSRRPTATTGRSPPRSATRAACARSGAVREAGLETCVGGILNLGETREQRVEMAFELAEIDPTSVPINMLNPRPGTKFGDREFMDPWEAVKWIAIFRLILPEALFRLCGGRVENLGELQQLAVQAGINGVMMGNFLTTLGNKPETDRSMFEELGLNVARQPDNAANPRPDNRSGWMEGETPDVVEELVSPRTAASSRRMQAVGPLHAAPLQRQARVPPRPDGGGRHADTVPWARRDERHRRAPRRAGASRPLAPPADDQPAAGATVLLDGRPVLLLCSNNYLGLADHPRVREAAADAARRWGVGAGASRLVSGSMTIHRRLEERLAAFEGTRGMPAVRLGVPGQHRRDRRARRRRGRDLLRRAQPRLDRRRLPPVARRGR